MSYLKPDIRKYKKGEFIHMEGNPVKNILILLEGGVQIIREDFSGTRSLMMQFLPGDTFYEAFAFIKLQKSPLSSYAVVDSLVMIVPYEHFITAMESAAQIRLKMGRNLLSIVAHKYINVIAHLEHISKPDIRKKIISYLAEQRNITGKNEFVIPISKTDLADFLFINRSAMTRELALMKKDKLINFKGRKFKIF
ncbi:MAG: Crp/Fnr family transcriptional regulator [Endomicrobia bacterium]|nr:Crp/Fnr family transcriptional regulator [Endomicrobiia bacterium]